MYKVMGVKGLKGADVKGKVLGEYESRAEAFKGLGEAIEGSGDGYVCFLVTDEEQETWTILPNNDE